MAYIGTIYILMVVAAMAEKKWLTSLCVLDITQLCSIIHHPDIGMNGYLPGSVLVSPITSATPMGCKIINSLIPAITNLRNAYPVSFSTMFSNDILQELGLPSMINYGDLDASDHFFETVLSK
jgi:hypothetical protein